MNRHRVDTSVQYSKVAYDDLPPSRPIEVAEGDTVEELEKPQVRKVEREPYYPDERLVKAVDLAIALGRPLLLQGDPGCGKTRLAYAVAYALGLPLEKCYIKSTSRAQDLLYTYDAVKRLYDAQLPSENRGQSLNVHHYIHLGPLGRALIRAARYKRRSVVLIDEIDKADIDFPNDLLLELDRLEFSVAEAPDMHYEVADQPELRPIVIVTHNEEKALPDAFLRRCIFHYLSFPEQEEQLQRILKLHNITDTALSKKAIAILQGLRSSDLNLIKKPGLSELLDWVGYLEACNVPAADLEKGQLPFLGALLKLRNDLQRVEDKERSGVEDKEQSSIE